MESGCPDLTNESSLQKTERRTIIRLTRNHLVFLPSVLTERSHFLSFNINSKEADFFIADQITAGSCVPFLPEPELVSGRKDLPVL